MPERGAAGPGGAFARELRRSASLRLALGALVALASLAVLAPLVASDRPWRLVAVDRWAWDGARRALDASLAALGGALGRDEPEALALERELGAARLHLATLERLADERPAFAELEDVLARVDALVARPGAPPLARAEVARDARRAAEALAPRLDALAGALPPRASWPLLQALAPADAALAALWLALLPGLVALVARGRTRLLRPRALLAAGGLALALGLAWTAVHDPAAAVRGARIKPGLANGSIVAESALFPPLAMGYAETHLEEPYAPPSWIERGPGDVPTRPGEAPAGCWQRHLLGTDAAGRDVLARVLWGGRASLAIGLVAASLLVAIGTAVGALAGWAGGLVDLALSRAIEVVQAFPALLLVLVVLAFADPRALPAWLAVALVIAAVGWTSVARLVRAEVLRVRGEDHVAAARSLGLSPARVLLAHVLPNAAAPAIVAFGFALAGGILVESTVSFLGFGIDEPTPSWGGLVAETRSLEHWWLVLFPGLCIFAAALAAHRLGEGLRAALAPRDELLAGAAPRAEAEPALAPRRAGPAGDGA